jgi:MOSC domain-containing protein YiiM
MNVERIFTAQRSGEPQLEQQSVRVVAGSGIEGDRNFGLHNDPGQNLTLIEIEEVEAFLVEHRRGGDVSITHRNLLTRGVRLNELVGVEFMVGEVRVCGVELCEPCLGLGNALASPALPPAAVVKRFLHRGGLRADVLSSGDIERGASITVPPRPSATGVER